MERVSFHTLFKSVTHVLLFSPSLPVLLAQVLLTAYYILQDIVSLVQFLFHFFRNRGLKGALHSV